MALSLANMLARVKRNVPTTTMDTELQDALLERMNYLTTVDAFPFQESYKSVTVPSGDYNVATPDNYAYIKNITLWMGPDQQRDIEVLDATVFSGMFPKPDERGASEPSYCCVRIAEGEIWFDCPMDGDQVIRMEFYSIPDDATDTTVSQLTELAKLALVKWASADGFRMMGEHDRAGEWEAEGDKLLSVMQRRYQLAKEKDTRFISLKEWYTVRRNN